MSELFVTLPEDCPFKIGQDVILQVDGDRKIEGFIIDAFIVTRPNRWRRIGEYWLLIRCGLNYHERSLYQVALL